MAQLFYLCTEDGCKRKYKTAGKWVNHLTKGHGVENPALPDPVDISKNKQPIKKRQKDKDEAVERAKQERRRLEEQQRREQELELRAIQDAENALIEKYGSEYTDQQEEIIKIQQRVKEHPDECCICYDAPPDTAVIPCGHAYFCHPCLFNHQTNYNDRGCPFCRGPINSIIKIYQ